MTLHDYVNRIRTALKNRLGDTSTISGAKFFIPNEYVGLKITPEDIWFAVRSARHYFKSASAKFHNVRDFRGPVEELSDDKVAGILIQMCIEHLDGYKERPERRGVSAFTHCRYCFQPLFVTVQAFFNTLVGNDFGMTFVASTQELFENLARYILEGVQIQGVPETEDEGDAAESVEGEYIDTCMDYLQSIDDLHAIEPFVEEVKRWLTGLKGELTLDTWGEVLASVLKRMESTPADVEPESCEPITAESPPSDTNVVTNAAAATTTSMMHDQGGALRSEREVADTKDDKATTRRREGPIN